MQENKPGTFRKAFRKPARQDPALRFDSISSPATTATPNIKGTEASAMLSYYTSNISLKSYTVPHIPICAHTIKAYLTLFWSLTQTQSTCKVSFSQDRICMDDRHEGPPQLCHRMISMKKRIYVFPLSLAAMACNYVASKLLEPLVFPRAAKWNRTVSPC